MADKLKPGISVRTTFVDGESPKAAKLNSLSSQLQNASQRLEAVIGDLHSESYPYSSLTSVHLGLPYGREKASSAGLLNAPTRALDVANLGRLIGPASNLNPHQMESQSLTEAVPAGVHEFSTHFPPQDPLALSFTDIAVFATLVAAPEDLNATGEYYVDSFGRVYTVDTTNGGTVTYTYNPRALQGGNTYQNASFNVIPDINQCENGVGCTVGGIDANGRRPVTLPVATHHHYNIDGTTVTLAAADPLYNQALLLPKILIDNWSAEEEIPGGFLYVKNYTKNKVYKQATYYYNSSSSVLMSGEDITNDVNDGDTFCIITVGTDITTSIDDLRKKLHHSHDRSFGEPLVPVQALVGILSAAGNSGVFVPSEIPGNFAPQYLHRDGFNRAVDNSMNDRNVLRGDLGIGVDGAPAGTSVSASGASYKLRFFGKGSGADANDESTIHKDANGNLEIEAGVDDFSVDYQIQAKSPFIIEKGIKAGNDGLTHTYAVKPLVFVYGNQVSSSSNIALNLDATAGLTNEVPVGIQVMVKQVGDTQDTWATGTTGTKAIEYKLYGPDSTLADWALVIELTGSSWGGGAPDTEVYDVRVMLWYLA